MARFGHPVLFPHQNDSVAVMSSKIDQFESFQVRLLIHRMFECLEKRRETSVCCTAVCVLAEPADAHLVSRQLPRRCLTPSSTRPCSCPTAGDPVLWQGQGGGEDTRVLPAPNQRHRCGRGAREVQLASSAAACMALLPSGLPAPVGQLPVLHINLMVNPFVPTLSCRVSGSGGRHGRADRRNVVVGGIPGGAS